MDAAKEKLKQAILEESGQKVIQTGRDPYPGLKETKGHLTENDPKTKTHWIGTNTTIGTKNAPRFEDFGYMYKITI